MYITKKEGSGDSVMKNQISISIFGSCVSRDAIEFDKQGKNKLDLKEYIARQSIVTSIGEAIPCQLEEINLASKFQQRLVYNDLSKQTFHTLQAAKSNYCMIDLIDERFPIGKWKNTLITISNEFRQSNYAEGKELRICDKKLIQEKNTMDYIIDDKRLSWYMDQFIEKLLNIYKGREIILHLAYFNDYYYTKDGEKKEFAQNILEVNKRENQLLQYMYEYLKKNVTEAICIKPESSYLAAENHKWGLSPMHYQKEYYLEALEQLYQQLI